VHCSTRPARAAPRLPVYRVQSPPTLRPPAANPPDPNPRHTKHPCKSKAFRFVYPFPHSTNSSSPQPPPPPPTPSSRPPPRPTKTLAASPAAAFPALSSRRHGHLDPPDPSRTLGLLGAVLPGPASDPVSAFGLGLVRYASELAPQVAPVPQARRFPGPVGV
jgi:hypothetical protein